MAIEMPKFIVPLISTESSILKQVITDAADFAANWGHSELSDWHCFPVLLSGFSEDPITKAVLGGRLKSDFLGEFEKLIVRYLPIQEISGFTFLLKRLIYRMCVDENDVLHLGNLGVAHFYLAYLSRPNNVVYSIYRILGIDVKIIISNIIHETGVRYPDNVVLYYYDMHDIWHKMEERMLPKP